jgi:large subunit ribosomal protein L15
MLTLESLKNFTKIRKKVKRVGRGLGSGLGKTCGRGEKGAGSRSGYKRRYTYEGGQFRMFMKMPCRGFSNIRFRNAYESVNLDQIEAMFSDGDVVNAESLTRRGFITGRNKRIKLLGNGELTRKVSIEVDAISESAREKLQKAKTPFTVPEKHNE